MKTTNKGLRALTTSRERKEIRAVGRKPVILRYLKGSKEKMAWAEEQGFDVRMWDVIEPKLPGYTYDGGYPTFTLTGLKERGLI